jgi:hypothetical protein
MFTESNEVKLGVVITFSTIIDLSDYEAAKQKMEEAVSTWIECHIRVITENIAIPIALFVHVSFDGNYLRGPFKKYVDFCHN